MANSLFYSTNTKTSSKQYLVILYDRVDYICSLYTVELLHFSKRLKKIHWRKLVLYYMYHTRAHSTYYVVMMHCTLIKHVSKIAKYEFAELCLRPTFS